MSNNAVMTTFKQFCSESGVPFHQVGLSTFLGFYGGQHGKWSVSCRIQGTILCFSSVLPVTVPREQKAAVLEYLNRANWELNIGNLEMDLAEGEVQLRTSVDCADICLTPATIGVLLFRNLLACDHFLPGLLRILFANASPLDAIQAIKATESEELDTDFLSELLDDVDLGELPEPGDD